ncbi:uncharacterized protein [Ptychodera flava]|uniref:uncharacterized protein n=1 Tax=Ptychodera flava TaxID=63121 RepID=UPI00396A7459
MGAFASSFEGSQAGVVHTYTDSTQPDWLTAHAKACKMDLPDVERLWSRFQYLGCDDRGVLDEPTLQRKVKDDVFLKQIVRYFPRDREGNLHFQTFCNAMKWFERPDPFSEMNSLEIKIRAIFKTLNGEEPVSQDLLTNILSKIYAGESREDLSKRSQLLMSCIDDKKQGKFDEEQFVAWIKKLPQKSVKSILEFTVVPTELREYAQGRMGAPGMDNRYRPTKIGTSEMSLRTVAEEPKGTRDPSGRPTNGVLFQISYKISQRDWLYFANKLGFTELEVEKIKRWAPGRHRDQVFELLQRWVERDGMLATVSALEEALVDSGMADVAHSMHAMSRTTLNKPI